MCVCVCVCVICFCFVLKKALESFLGGPTSDYQMKGETFPEAQGKEQTNSQVEYSI